MDGLKVNWHSIDIFGDSSQLLEPILRDVVESVPELVRLVLDHLYPLQPQSKKELVGPPQVTDLTLITEWPENQNSPPAYAHNNDCEARKSSIHLNCNYILARFEKLKPTASNATRTTITIPTRLATDVSLLKKSANISEVLYEVKGVLVHELVHVFQHTGNDSAPGWFVEGIADYVRYRAGYPARHWPTPDKIDKEGEAGYEAGYEKTGYFLDFIETRHPGLISNWNASLGTSGSTWDVGCTKLICGSDLSELWCQYKQ